MSNIPIILPSSYNKYKIPAPPKIKTKKELNNAYDDICYPHKFELQKPQKLLADVLKPGSEFKSLLIYHKIGSGKTCTAITIAEEWKHKKQIIFVSPASLQTNFRNELRSMCGNKQYISDKDK